MNFKEKKSIYLQIADRVCDEILLGHYAEDERIPSVREYASTVEVNVNTMVRTYDHLQNKEILYNKRGLGYFVSLGAKKRILAVRKEEFMEEDLPELFHRMKLLGVSVAEISFWYEKYLNNEKNH